MFLLTFPEGKSKGAGNPKGQKGPAAAERPVDISRLDLKIGRIVSAEKVIGMEYPNAVM